MTDSAPTTPLQDANELGDLLLEVLPPDGSTLGNLSARQALSKVAEREVGEEEYDQIRDKALLLGTIKKGRGRGGSIALGEGIEGGSRYEPPTAPTSGSGRAKKESPAKDFKAVLWASADKLRAQMDAAEYKHLVLGLIFLKYISDTFVEQQQKVLATVSNPESDYYLGDDPADHQEALEDRDYYTQENVFWVPADARWESLRNQAKQPDIGQLIDRALVAIENENPTLRGKLDKRFGAAQLEPGRMGELVDLISTIGFGEGKKSGDVLGEVYEYFLGQFASAEGKKGGQFYTPAHVVKTLVAVLAPHKGRVYDPCCGSGGMFVQSERFVESHGGRRDDISIYGQESNPTTWRLAAMNLAIRGFAADLGQEPADTFARDQHPDQKFDYILANPPFNISDWGGEKYDSDPRWTFGRPPAGNANYAWLQHMLWKLRPGGEAGVVLANGSMSANTSGEGQIREAMVRGDAVEVMVALPGQLFLNTPIPVCVWFLTNDKTQRGRDRRGETLFIDARQMGSMVSRVERVLTDEDIAKVADTVHAWRGDGEVETPYEDVSGFCYSAKFDEIEKNSFVLTPGRYVGAADQEEDDEPFDQKMKRLTTLLKQQQEEGAKLDQQIAENLRRVGFES
ncbi:Putative Type I restriction-modification system M subunit [Synechococcus sp. RS9907]|uniref:class I SAM-dependent DNA methyltransferase n=1 Tax=Synechococcus sp. RS9907 TaxID=221350 RepID=UPI00165E8045|nr:class I SAM-dependent DNA methyltransferase [Synechococcus sp. RS9907]QNI81666.1 Putative Type I restriction-modification system M subunit [Synechococcus sp. RS9907]